MTEDKCYFTGSDIETMKSNARKHAELYFGKVASMSESTLDEFYMCQQIHYDICNRISSFPDVVANQLRGLYPSQIGSNCFYYELAEEVSVFDEQKYDISLARLSGEKGLYSVSLTTDKVADPCTVFVNWWFTGQDKRAILSKCSEIVESKRDHKLKLEMLKDAFSRAEWNMIDLPQVVQIYRDFASLIGGEVVACFLRNGQQVDYKYGTTIQCTASMMGKLNEIIIKDIQKVFKLRYANQYEGDDEYSIIAKIKYNL